MLFPSTWPPASCRVEAVKQPIYRIKECWGVGNDDDQLGELKDWWQRNGKPLVTGGMLALVVVFGWQFWHKYQTNQSQGASILYQQLLETTRSPW